MQTEPISKITNEQKDKTLDKKEAAYQSVFSHFACFCENWPLKHRTIVRPKETRWSRLKMITSLSNIEKRQIILVTEMGIYYLHYTITYNLA